MDYDINNQQALQSGAYFQQRMASQSDGWSPMDTAPKDGTVIEIRCTYGVAPWYGLFRWTGERSAMDQNGERHPFTTTPTWVRFGNDSSSVDGGSSFTWRPYKGDTASYVDPTGGMHDSAAYWRGAVAAKYGKPLDYFEKETARNGAINSGTDYRGFWSRLFDWWR